MSLEQAINTLNASVLALTATMAAGGGAAAATAATTPPADKSAAGTKPRASAYKAQHTQGEAEALVMDVKEKLGKDKAVELRDKYTSGKKIADAGLSAQDIDKLYDEAKEALAAAAADDDV